MIFDIAELPAGAKLRVTGTELFILHKETPEKQLWLGFPGCFIVPVEEAKTPRNLLDVHDYSLKKLRRAAAQPYARTGPVDRLLYQYQRHQYVLPFVEGRRVSYNEMGRLGTVGHPGWDRLRDGGLVEVTIPQSRAKEAITWVDQHVSGRVNIAKSRTLFTFEKTTEGAMFKMLFSAVWNNA